MFLLRCCVATKKDEGEREFPLLAPTESSEKPGKPSKGDSSRRAEDRPERADYGLLGQKRPSYGADCTSCPSNLVVHIPCDPEEEREQCRASSAMLPADDNGGDTENDDDERCREDGCLLDSTCSSTARLLDDRTAAPDYLGDINQSVEKNNYANIIQSDELTPGPSPSDQDNGDTEYLSPECVIFEMDGNLPAPPVYLFRNEEPPSESTIVNLLTYSQCLSATDGAPHKQGLESETSVANDKILSVFGYDDLCNTGQGETFNDENQSLIVFPEMDQSQSSTSEACISQHVLNEAISQSELVEVQPFIERVQDRVMPPSEKSLSKDIKVTDQNADGVIEVVEELAQDELSPVDEHLVSHPRQDDDILIDSVSSSFVTELLREVMNTLREMPQEIALEISDQLETLRSDNDILNSPEMESNEFATKVEESANECPVKFSNDTYHNSHFHEDVICNGEELDQNSVELNGETSIHSQVLVNSSVIRTMNSAYVVDCQFSNPCSINNNEDEQFSIPCSTNSNEDEQSNIPCGNNNIDYELSNNSCSINNESDHNIEPFQEASRTLEEIGHEIATDAIKAAFQDFNDEVSADSENSSKCDNESNTIERKPGCNAAINDHQTKENSISKSNSSKSSLTENSPEQCSPVEKSVVVNMSDSLIDRLFPDSYDGPEIGSENPAATEHQLINIAHPAEHQLIHTVLTTEYQLMDTAVNIQHQSIDTAHPFEDQPIDVSHPTEHHLTDSAILTTEPQPTGTAISITEHRLIDTALSIEEQLIHNVHASEHQMLDFALTTCEQQLINTSLTTSEHQSRSTAFTASEHKPIDTVLTIEPQLIDTALLGDLQQIDNALFSEHQLKYVSLMSESQDMDSDHTINFQQVMANTSGEQNMPGSSFSENQLLRTEIQNIPQWIDTEVTIALPLLSHDFIGEKLYKLCLSTAFPDPPLENHDTVCYKSVSSLERINSSDDNEQDDSCINSDQSLIDTANNIVRSIFDNVDVINAQHLKDTETTNEQQLHDTEISTEQQLYDSKSSNESQLQGIEIYNEQQLRDTGMPNEQQLRGTGMPNEQQLQNTDMPNEQQLRDMTMSREFNVSHLKFTEKTSEQQREDIEISCKPAYSEASSRHKFDNLEFEIADSTIRYEEQALPVISCHTWTNAADWREADSGSIDIPPPPPLTEDYPYTDVDSELIDIPPPPLAEGYNLSKLRYSEPTVGIHNNLLTDLKSVELPRNAQEASPDNIESISDICGKNRQADLSCTENVRDNLSEEHENATDVAQLDCNVNTGMPLILSASSHDSDSIGNSTNDQRLRNDDVICQAIKSHDVTEANGGNLDEKPSAWQYLSNEKTWWNWGRDDADNDNEDNNDDDVFSTKTTQYCPVTPARPTADRRAKSDIERFFAAYVLDLTKISSSSPDDVQSANVRPRRELDIQPLAGGLAEKVIFNVGHYDDDDEEYDDDAFGASVTGDKEFTRPVSMRRSASLKTSPEATPHKKKVVRFADALGLDLTSIRTIRTSDDNLPAVNTPALMSSPAELLSTGTMANQRHYFCPGFVQPVSSPDFATQVRLKLVLLESCAVDDSHTSLNGVVRVWNVSFRKDVTIRHTVDGWITSSDSAATYVPSPSLGGATTDRFAFRFTLALPICYQGGCRVEFAIRYRTGDNLELEYWDNNEGANYPLECYTNSDDANQANWMCFL